MTRSRSKASAEDRLSVKCAEVEALRAQITETEVMFQKMMHQVHVGKVECDQTDREVGKVGNDLTQRVSRNSADKAEIDITDRISVKQKTTDLQSIM